MADSFEVVEKSININNKLGPKLLAAAEQNAILRIGWNPAGDKVPKNGELGLCPALPKGSRMRGLGVLVLGLHHMDKVVPLLFKEILGHS